MIHQAHYNAIGLAPKIEQIVQQGLTIARDIDDRAHRLLFLYNIYGTRLTQGRYEEALGYAEEFAELAAKDQDTSREAFSQRVMALGLWRAGRLQDAFSYGARAMSTGGEARSPVTHTLLYKQGVTAGASQANLLWLMGHADQAIAAAEDAIDSGLRYDVTGLCYALSHLIVPLSFWLGDNARTRANIDLLIEQSTKNHLGSWLFWGRCYDALLSRAGRDQSGDDFLSRNFASLSGLHRHVLATISDTSDLGVDMDVELSAKPHWATPELFRRHALTRIACGDLEEAEILLERALSIASAHGSKAWQLRTASTLAQLKVDQNRSSEAGPILLPLLGEFKEGHGTEDYRAADKLARALRPQLRAVN